MSHGIRFFSFLTSLALFPSVSWAGDFSQTQNDAGHLSLDEAVQEAKDHSPTLQRFRAITGESEWRKSEALGAGFLPKLSSSATHYFNTKYQYLNVQFGGSPILFPSIYPTTTLSFDVSIPVFDGLANLDHLKAASLAQSAAENEERYVEFQIEEDVKLAYYQALGAQELEEVAKQNIKTLEEHLKIAQVRQAGGSGTKYDVLRVQVQLSAARTDGSNATDNVTITRRKLTQLLGIKADDRPLAGQLPVPQAEMVQSLTLNELPSTRRDIQALDQKASAADKEDTAKAKWLVPSVSLVADYTMYNNVNSSLSSTSLYRSAYNTGVFLRWNVFDGGVSLARSQQAKYQRIQADRAAEEAKEQIPYDFELWKRKYLTNTARYAAKKLDVESSEENVRLARAEERAGTRNSTEVLDAELDLFRSKAGVVDALLSSAEAKVQLEKTLGRVL